jgi:hypothetical protein
MSAQASQTQWYLAREGQQFGPISEAELAKFIELGHLQPTDLLWREGFADWRPALIVFPPQAPAPPAIGPTLPRGPATDPSPRLTSMGRPERPAREEDYDDDPAPRGRFGRIMVVLLVLVIVGGAGAAAYLYRDRVTDVVASLASFAPSADTRSPTERKSFETPPLTGFRGTPEEVDARLQATALWSVLKRDFPDWYKQRLDELTALARDNPDDAAVGQEVARKLVELRRQNVANALSATLPKLKSVAVAFYDSLAKLRRHSVQACHGFIAEGQASPAIVALLQQGTEHTVHLQTQLTSVFEAIAEGRTQPRVYPRAQQADYQMLAADLIKMGWTQEDMRVFSNQTALAQASPEKVCQLVHDWFAAQLAIQNEETQMRLLVDSLRPIFAG